MSTLVEERFGINPYLEFTSEDLNSDVYDRLKEETEEKAKQFFNNEASRRGRTLELIEKNTWDGMVAEKYLIQELGMADDPGMWRDLKVGDYRLEVKTFSSAQSKYNTIMHLENSRKTKYDHVVFFYREGNKYKMDSYYTYDHDKEVYVLEENFGDF